MRSMHTVHLAAADDLDGWRDAARALAGAGVPAEQVLWQVGAAPADLFAGPPLRAQAGPALRVHKEFMPLAACVILHRDPQRFALLYALLLRVMTAPQLVHDTTDPLRRRVEVLSKTIRRDMHKMRAFVRFRAIETDGAVRYVAWFEPENNIVRANAAFFAARFANMDWSILTPDISVHWDGGRLREGPGATVAQAAGGDPLEEVWKSYYRAIFNPARLNRTAMLSEMPKKYWKNLPEAALIPEMMATARAREIEMIARSAADKSAG